MAVSDARRAVLEAVGRAAEAGSLWNPDATVVVAVSGGADSLCLLGALIDLRESRPDIAPTQLVVATLDHGLRGAAGAEDIRWVAALAARLGLRCVAGQAQARELANQRKISIEDAARRLRYRFLRAVASDVDATRICVAHTMDDQAETILLHLARGTGLPGLAGMRLLSGDLARPLLSVRREQTVACCAERGWEPRQDETNLDTRFTRNRVRRDLIPALEAF